MTKQEFANDFIRQFTSDETIHPFTRFKHMACAFVEYARSYSFYALTEKERDQACTIFSDQLYAYEQLMKHYDELFSQKAYLMRRVFPDVLKGANFATLNKHGQQEVKAIFGEYELEEGISNKL